MTFNRGRAVVALLAAACAAVPLAAVTFPPITDLPQHVVQIRLALETFGQADGPYRIQWLAPYGLSYLALGLGWLLAGPVGAGRIGVGILLLIWVLALHRLAAVRRRPVAGALLATTLGSSFALYNGFLPFLGGFPWFLWWLERTARSEREPERTVTPREVGVLTALATALYLTHAHWFAVAAIWLGISGLVARLPWRFQLMRGLALVPGALLGLLWLRLARDLRLDSSISWGVSIWRRWAPEELVAAIVAGPRGLGRELLLMILVLWISLGLLAWARGRSGVGIDRRLLGAGCLLLLIAALAPEKFMSLWAARRWWAPGVALIVLSVPAPWGANRPRRALLASSAAAVILLLWTTITVRSWRRFERVELAGLSESLTALPPESRLLGLSYTRRTRAFDEHPFMHCYAYGQAWKGGTTNFSFASFPASPVVDREFREVPWTASLEWMPEKVRRSDFAYFDFVLVHGARELLETLPSRAPIEPVTSTVPWRLYRVVR